MAARRTKTKAKAAEPTPETTEDVEPVTPESGTVSPPASDITDDDVNALRALDIDLDAAPAYLDEPAEQSARQMAAFNKAAKRTERTATVGDTISFGVRLDSDKLEKAEKDQDRSGWPRLICMRMGKPEQNVAGLHAWGVHGLETLKFRPFTISPPLNPKFVASVTKPRKNRAFGTHWYDYFVEPPVDMVDMATGRVIEPRRRGDCGGTMTFNDPITGRPIPTCIYGDCPRHPRPPGIYHSEWQAMKFLALLKNDSVIRRYVRDFDPRPNVVAFAHLVISQRQKQLLEQMGTGSNANENIIF